MKNGRDYEQSYNAQATVDSERQVIVGQSLGNEQNDVHELLPLVDQVRAEWSLLCTAHNPRSVVSGANLLKLAAARA